MCAVAAGETGARFVISAKELDANHSVADFQTAWRGRQPQDVATMQGTYAAKVLDRQPLASGDDGSSIIVWAHTP